MACAEPRPRLGKRRARKDLRCWRMRLVLLSRSKKRRRSSCCERGCHLVVLSSRTHHGIPRLQGIAREKGKEVFIVEREEEVDTIRLTRFEPIGVIVQTTFWLETYKKIIARILERFANVQIRNTACIDSLQRLPEVEKLAKQVDAIIIFGWTEGMTTRMVEVARAFNAHVHKIEKVD